MVDRLATDVRKYVAKSGRYGRSVDNDRMAVEDQTGKSSCEEFGSYSISNGKSKLVF